MFISVIFDGQIRDKQTLKALRGDFGAFLYFLVWILVYKKIVHHNETTILLSASDVKWDQKPRRVKPKNEKMC